MPDNELNLRSISKHMACPIEFPAQREIGALAKIVNEEANRLCRIIDTATSWEVREQGLRALRELADTVRVIIGDLQSDSEEFDFAETKAFKAAA